MTIVIKLKNGKEQEIDPSEIKSLIGGYGCPCCVARMKDGTEYKTQHTYSYLNKYVLEAKK
jgi:natural product precursor